MKKPEAAAEPLDYPSSVAVTWRLSFDQLRERSPGAARLLELCAYFAPDPISLSLPYGDEMISALLPIDARLSERTVMGQLIRDLERYSLAKVDRGRNSIQVHHMIQAAIRAQMGSPQSREAAMHEVHQVLAGARPRQGDVDDLENWTKYDLIWPHLGPSAAYSCASPDTRQLLIERVRYLWRRGEFEAALGVGERLREHWSETARPGDTLQTAGGLGGDLRSLGRFREALDLDERTYGQTRDVLGADHPRTLSAANNLALSLRLVGHCVRARDIDLETLSQRERPTNSPGTPVPGLSATTQQSPGGPGLQAQPRL